MRLLIQKKYFFFDNTYKVIPMTKEDKEDIEDNNLCHFFEKNIESDKVRDHCHLTGKYRGPANSNCNINVKQNQSNFIKVILHNFSIYDCHLF